MRAGEKIDLQNDKDETEIMEEMVAKAGMEEMENENIVRGERKIKGRCSQRLELMGQIIFWVC